MIDWLTNPLVNKMSRDNGKNINFLQPKVTVVTQKLLKITITCEVGVYLPFQHNIFRDIVSFLKSNPVVIVAKLSALHI